jgi:adenylate cyclase
MAADERNVAVMFADVAGSTKLYEQLGDAQALAAIGECLALVASTAQGHGGRLVKTIGDEAMVVFSDAAAAVSAAGEIQQRMADLTRVRSVRVAFRIGINSGSALEVAGDVFGDSVNVAARMVGLAKSGQVIVSGQTAAALPPELRARLREVDFLTVKGKERDVVILELVWQDSGDLTTLAPRPKVRVARLALRHGARMIELGPATLALTLGRDAQNDIVIADRLGSRLHARIERRRDKFVLVDQSSNGTFVTVEGEGEIALRREEFMLRRRGHVSFGHPYARDSAEVLHFDCVEGDTPS